MLEWIFTAFRWLFWIARHGFHGGTGEPTLDTSYPDGVWIDVPVTFDQLRIERALARLPLEGSSVLHVGVGSSRIARKFHRLCRHIDGVTVSMEEKSHGEAQGYANYSVFLVDKYTLALRDLPRRYDYIVDNNPTSYAPGEEGFLTMMESYIQLLKPGGRFLSDLHGMSYHKDDSFGIDDRHLRPYADTHPVRFFALTRLVCGLEKLAPAGSAKTAPGADSLSGAKTPTTDSPR